MAPIREVGLAGSAEGFDDARLGMVFLTMPISWRGMLSHFLNMPDRCTVCTVQSETSSPTLPFLGSSKDDLVGFLLAKDVITRKMDREI